MKKIKTFKAACKALGIKKPESVLPPYNKNIDEATNKSIIAYAKLIVIVKALNGNWVADWDNDDQWKYYPWFTMSSSGFVYLVYDVCYSISDAGSRLCFKSRQLAEYA